MLSSKFPNEILLNIFKGLDYNSILKICMVNKRFSNVCKDRIFWIQYLKQLGYEELLKDKTLEELRTLVDYQTASVDYVYSLYKQEKYELFATYVLGKDIVDEILDVINDKGKIGVAFENFAWKLSQNTYSTSSQNLKDLSLICMTHDYIDFYRWDDEDINLEILNLIKIVGSNPFRGYKSYSIYIGNYKASAYETIEESLLHPKEDLESLSKFIEKFQPKLDVSLPLLVKFLYDDRDNYIIMMNYIANNYSESKLHIDLYWYESLSRMNRDHIIDYLNRGEFVVLKTQPSDEILENQDLAFNRYRDQFIIDVDHFEPLF